MVKQITEVETESGVFKSIVELIQSQNENTLYLLEYCEFNGKEYSSIDEIEKIYNNGIYSIKEEIEGKLLAFRLANQANNKLKEKNGE